MSHFRCPSSSLVGEANLYTYQPIAGLDESQLFMTEEETEFVSTNSSSISRTASSNSISQQRPLYNSNISSRSIKKNPSSASTTTASSLLLDFEQPKRCWICFGEEADSEGRWVRPCQCSLISHEACLLDWIAETQKQSPLKKVSCPQCGSHYHLQETQSLPLVLMNIMNSLMHTAAPYITVLGLGCSMLITSTTFGAYTILTLFGTTQGERLIGNPACWTWRTWIGLPSIPVALAAFRLKWADNILPAAALLLLQMSGTTSAALLKKKVTWPPSPAVMFGLLPWVRLLYNNIYALAQRKLSHTLLRQTPSRSRSSRSTANTLEEIDTEEEVVSTARSVDQDTEVLFGREGRDMSVTVIGALLWPTVSSIVGSYLNHSRFVRKYFPEPFHRNVLGGCLFVVAKDITNLFYKYERIRQRRSRRVVNLNEKRQTKNLK